MGQYVTRRILVSIPTLIGISVLIFLVMRVLPGDPVSVVFGQESFAVLSQADQLRFRTELGLDKPLYLQYLDWAAAVVHGDLGRSFWQNETIRDVMLRRGPVTAQIALMATLLSWVIGVPVGVFSAVRRDSWQDNLTRVLATLFLAVPSFWLGAIIVVVGVIYFSWRPPLETASLWTDPLKNLEMTIGPAVALGAGAGAYVARMTRSSVLELLHADFVRTAGLGAGSHLAARVRQCRAARGDALRLDPGRSARRLGGRRGGLRRTWPGQVPGRLAGQARLHGGAEPGAAIRRGVHPGQPGDRPGLRLARPPHSV